MRKAAVSVLVVFMCILMFTGCYTGKNLEERITAKQIEKLETAMENSSDIKDEFSDVTIEVKENHITYKFTYGVYLDDLTILQMKSALLDSDLKKQMNEKIDTYKNEIEKRFKIRPSIVSFEFYTSDGRMIGKIEG